MPRQRPKPTPRTGSKILRVGAKTVEQLANPDYSDWDDDELMAGYRRDSRGQFNGSRPKVVPRELLMEMNRRIVSQGMHKFYAAALPALDYMIAVSDGTAVADKDRMNAARFLIERVFGVQPQRIEVSATSETPYEKAGIQRAIVLRGAIDVDSEEADNPFEED